MATLITYGRRSHGIIESESDRNGVIAELVRLHRVGAFPGEKLVTTFPLAEIDEVIADPACGARLRAVLLP